MSAAIGHGPSAFWYLTRSTGVVAYVLLSAAVVLGIVTTVGPGSERWPRFATQGLHRTVSLLCVVFVALHVVTTVADGYVPIGLVDALVPFRTPYRPLWIGLGAMTFDLLLAVLVTSLMRRRIGLAAWRGVHWLAYACWPIALLHALGSGTDARVAIVQVVYLATTAAVLAAVAWRLWTAVGRSVPERAALGAGALVVVAAVVAFAFAGPLRPGWSTRSGTSATVLAALGRAQGATNFSPPAPVSSSGGLALTPATAGAAVPAPPFSDSLAGSLTERLVNSGRVEVTLALHLVRDKTPLTVQLVGKPEGTGVAMSSGTVDLGGDRGKVTTLDGTRIGATVSGQLGPVAVSLSTQISGDRSVSGTITGIAA